MKLLLRWLISAIAVVAAVWIVPGIDAGGSGWIGVAVMAAVLTLPITAITLGLFLLVINGFTLWLAAWLTDRLFDEHFVVDGFLDAIFGGIIISVVSMILQRILLDEDES